MKKVKKQALHPKLQGRSAAVLAVAVLVLTVVSGCVIRQSHAAGYNINVDGASASQTITALGVSINSDSWDNGNLKPALDMLIDQEGAKTFRVVMEMTDWETTNDDANPSNFNWNYYNPIYSGQVIFDTAQSGSNFANLWNTIDYLHQKGIPNKQIILSFMGIGPSWMGGSSLNSAEEDEWVEEVLSAAYYGYTHGHTFGYFSPDNEEDIGHNEGITMSDTLYTNVMNRLAGRMNVLGLNGIRLLGPETCCNVGYTTTMMNGSYPALMGKIDHFDFHDYTGNTHNAATVVAPSGKDFWMSEYSWFSQSFPLLDQGSSGLMMWDAYDSVYNHAILNGLGSQPGNDAGSTAALIAYNSSTKTYTPRSYFYQFEQLFKYVPLGSVRVSAASDSTSVLAEAFTDPASGRVTILGDYTGTSVTTVTVNLANVPTATSYDVYQTTTSLNAVKTGTATVSGGSLTATINAGAYFTITATDTAPAPTPTATTTASATPLPTPEPFRRATVRAPISFPAVL